MVECGRLEPGETSPMETAGSGGASVASEAAVEQAATLTLDFVTEAEPQDEAADVNTTRQATGKLEGFSLQLVEEFLTQHKLLDTVAALQAELQRKRVTRPSTQLWFEMQQNCRAALSRGGVSANSSTLERLLAFCVAFGAPRGAGGLALDLIAPAITTVYCSSPQSSSVSKLKQSASFSLRQAQHQMLSPVVRPSQRRHHQPASKTPEAGGNRPRRSSSPSETGANPSSTSQPVGSEAIGLIQHDDDPETRPSSLLTANVRPIDGLHASQHLAHSPKKHKSKKKKRIHSTVAHSAGSNNSSLLSVQQQHYRSQTPARSTETSLLTAHDAQLKHDLSCGRLLAREMRHLRVEHVTCEAVRRGAASLEAALARDDPYAKELVRERYGFIQRLDCALCAFPFLPVNLPHRVSFKCIMDLHAQWGYAPPHRELAARYRPPLCYDAVRVCRMCAPIIFQRTTALPRSYDGDRASPRPNVRRASSLSALATMANASPKAAVPTATCTDPYALPPLFADDVIEDGTGLSDEWSGEELRGGPNGLGGGGTVGESPAKAIVYALQTEAGVFMSSKEWEVIHPHPSSIRQVMKNSLKSS
ncbi:hypothetical protein BBJ28_00012311 [Nothophytophthora sp. Chile5]|nr:hypothetical protein BBJ28_00012311 [Nothophytophthora sp. Chile5]